MAKMDQLDKVEKEIVSCLHTAGQALAEIAKDKPSQKQVDLLVTQFMNNLATIDSSLADHIRYLSQVQPTIDTETFISLKKISQIKIFYLIHPYYYCRDGSGENTFRELT